MMAQRTYRDPWKGRTVTFGELDRETHDASFRRCVRCGDERPEPELFLGRRCLEDPETMLEVHNIEEGFTDYREQRKALRLFGWVGGWWR